MVIYKGREGRAQALEPALCLGFLLYDFSLWLLRPVKVWLFSFFIIQTCPSPHTVFLDFQPIVSSDLEELLSSFILSDLDFSLSLRSDVGKTPEQFLNPWLSPPCLHFSLIQKAYVELGTQHTQRQNVVQKREGCEIERTGRSFGGGSEMWNIDVSICWKCMSSQQ